MSTMDDRFISGLSELVAIKSVSTDRKYVDEIEDVVKWLQKRFQENSFDVKIFRGVFSNPIIFAHHKVSHKAETVLVYGHYDVQPADKSNGWESDPFSLEQRGNRFYGRGVVDNKGQFWIHMHTVFKLIEKNSLKYNVKFLLEGNEETSNPDIAGILEDNEELMRADHVLVSDGEIVTDHPVIETSLRGGFSVKINFKTATSNVHSGTFGGAVPNASYEMSRFLTNLLDTQNRVTIPGFYENVDPILDEERENNKMLSELVKGNISGAGFKALLTEEGNDYFSQIGQRPTIQITGINTGYNDRGFANIVPAKAESRLNFRIVASQKFEDVIRQFEKYVEKVVPEYVEYNLEYDAMHNPVKIDTSAPIVADVKELLSRAFEKEVLMKPVGGAIPIVGDFKELWGVDTLLVSLGNDDCHMHGPNENYKIDLIEKGLKFSKMFFGK